MEPKLTFTATELDDIDNYKLLSGLVTPRPIGWIGTVTATGERNLAPFSFFNVVCQNPPTLLFSVQHRRPHRKDTARNALASGEFTVNIVTEDTAEAMNETAGEYAADVDEFEVAGLTAVLGDVVAAPMVAEAAASFECRVTQHMPLGTVEGMPAYTVIFGEVVRYHIADRVLDGTRIDPHALRSIGRLAGSGYSRTADSYFEMARPEV